MGTVLELPIRRGLLGTTVTLLDGSLSQRTDALALQLETRPGRPGLEPCGCPQGWRDAWEHWLDPKTGVDPPHLPSTILR